MTAVMNPEQEAMMNTGAGEVVSVIHPEGGTMEIDIATVQLERNMLWKPDNRRGCTAICVCRGTIWVTTAGSAADHLLTTGTRRVLSGDGLLVQALDDARFQLRRLGK